MSDLSVWAFSMAEEKADKHRRLSMTRVAIAVFTVAFVVHFRFPLGWPDAFLGFCILFALPISKALDSAPAQAVVEAVTGMFGKGAEAAGSVWSRTSETVATNLPTPDEEEKA